jgi:hypothetical protein
MYPVTYAAGYPGDGRNRLTTFFRYFIAIPWLIVAAIYGFIASFAVLFAWFALVFTARYPEGLYNFVAGFLRFSSRVNAFILLATDEFPSFNGGEDPDYPVRIGVPEPKAEYSRVKAFFRIIVGIPVILLAYVQGLIASVIALIGWFAILFTGRISEGLFDPLRSALAYQTRANAYFYLLTEDWPPFSLEESPPVGQIPSGGAPAVPPAVGERGQQQQG